MFPEYRDLITRLKSEGTHQRFRTCSSATTSSTHQIANMGTQDAGTMHAAIEALKKEKLHVLTSHALLRQEAAAAG
jgi:uncharacterized protein YdcH (DUF465 family)